MANQNLNMTGAQLNNMSEEQLRALLTQLQFSVDKEELPQRDPRLNQIAPIAGVAGTGIGLAASGGNPLVAGLSGAAATGLTELALSGARAKEDKKIAESSKRLSKNRMETLKMIQQIQNALARKQASKEAMLRLQRQAEQQAMAFA